MKRLKGTARLLMTGALALSVFFAPFFASSAEASTLKATSGVNLRSSGSSSSARIGYIKPGTYARYLGMSNGYYKISVNGRIGYAHHSSWRSHKVTSTHHVNMRTAPSSAASRIAYIRRGTDVRVLGRYGDWVYIEHNGRRGYAHRSYWFMSSTMFRSCAHAPYSGQHHSGSHH